MNQRDAILKDFDIPAVPMVALKIMRIVDDPRAEVKAIQEVVMADQALAARILRMANSSFFGTNRRVDTISEAVIMMGFSAIRNLAMAVSTREVYKRFGLLEQKLWEHSIGVSVAAGLIAREVKFYHAEEVTVAGLLHDVGKVIMNNNYPDKFSHLNEMVYNERSTFSQKEKEVFPFGHAEVGGVFAHRWGFPDNLCDAIRRHHFDIFDNLADLEPDTRAICVILALADAICVRLGIGYRSPMTDIALKEAEYRKMIGMTEDQFTDMIERFKHAYVTEKMNYQL